MSLSTRRSRLMLVMVSLTVVVLAVYGIWSQRPNAPDDSGDTLRRITIAQFGDFFLYAPLYIAVDDGFFRQHGLDVSIVNTGGDDKTWAAVLSGSAEFGVADPTFVAVSAARGQNGIVVASLVNGVPFWGITYRDIAPLKDAKDLARYSVATFRERVGTGPVAVKAGGESCGTIRRCRSELSDLRVGPGRDRVVGHRIGLEGFSRGLRNVLRITATRASWGEAGGGTVFWSVRWL